MHVQPKFQFVVYGDIKVFGSWGNRNTDDYVNNFPERSYFTRVCDYDTKWFRFNLAKLRDQVQWTWDLYKLLLIKETFGN